MARRTKYNNYDDDFKAVHFVIENDFSDNDILSFNKEIKADGIPRHEAWPPENT